MNPRERLQYALYLRRLQDLFVIKENIAFEYQHKNFNKAAAQIDKVVDQCLNDNILNTVEGTVSLKNPKVDHVITEALTSQQKMLVKRPDKFMEKAVRDNTKQFSNFLQNRIEKENYSLQNKINEEYKKKKYSKMPEAEAKKILTEKFQDHARKRAKNIVRDALHTNQSHMSWINGIQGDFKYKVWMNGQGKGRVRPWHRAKLIQPVEIDDYFDIYGSSHVQMMYPGDLEGGAENVANCRCWLHYTNIAPSNLKPRGTIQINPNVSLGNGNRKTFSANTEAKGKSKKSNSDKSTSNSKKRRLITRIGRNITNFWHDIKNKINKKRIKVDSVETYTSYSDNPKEKIDSFVESQNIPPKDKEKLAIWSGTGARIIKAFQLKDFDTIEKEFRKKGHFFNSIQDVELITFQIKRIINRKSNKLGENIILYKGVKTKDIDLSKFVEGEVNEFDTHMSASLSLDTAKDFAKDLNDEGYIIKMYAHKTVKGAAINHSFNMAKEEYEILMKQSQKYITCKVDEVNKRIYIAVG